MFTHADVAGLKDSLAGAIKPENINSDVGSLEKYSRDNSYVKGSQPLLAVYPETKDELKRLVKMANEFKMPLTAVSSGPPHFHGGTIPSQSGIIVDFKKMNHILKIDAVNRCVMIEPGVNFGELIPALRKQGLRLNTPLLPRASKSVLTAYLEREPLLIPKYQYDYLDPLLTAEVIYGNGDEFRTGSASGPGDLEHLKSDKVNPWGPGSIDYIRFVSGAQGTMGLVTWATIKIEILPSLQKFYFITTTRLADLISLFSDLLRKRVVDECLALNNDKLAVILAEDQMDLAELKNNLPPWTAVVCIAGYQRHPEERVEIQQKQLINCCEERGLAALTCLPEAGGRETNWPALLGNVRAEEPDWKLQYNNSSQDIFFLSPMSRIAEYVELAQGLISNKGYPQRDMGCYIQPMVQGRGCHCEFSLPSDASPAAEVPQAQAFWLAASETLMRNGAFFSRPYGPWANMVYRRDAEGTAALRKLKSVFDPNNILNPGKLCF